MTNYKGEITISGKKHKVEVIKGIRYIDGKTVEEFMKTISIDNLFNFYEVGVAASKGENISPQKMMDEFHQRKNN